MTEHSTTIPIPDPTLPGYVPARAPTTAGRVASPHVQDDLVDATEARP
jgi:hypothetical protein